MNASRVHNVLAVMLSIVAMGCNSAEPVRQAEASTGERDAAVHTTATTQVAAEPRPEAFEIVTGAGYQGMILPSGSWRPTRSDVAAAESKLQSAIARGVSVDGRIQKVPPAVLVRYRRQYVGEGTQKQRMAIYLNCRLKDWPHQIAWGRGGGACFIRATWDVKREELISVVANSGS